MKDNLVLVVFSYDKKLKRHVQTVTKEIYFNKVEAGIFKEFQNLFEVMRHGDEFIRPKGTQYTKKALEIIAKGKEAEKRLVKEKLVDKEGQVLYNHKDPIKQAVLDWVHYEIY